MPSQNLLPVADGSRSRDSQLSTELNSWNPVVERVPKVHLYTRDKYWSTTRGPIDCPDLQTGILAQVFWNSPTLVSQLSVWGPWSTPCSGQLLLWVSSVWFWSLVHHSSLSATGFQSSAQCLAVGVCLCFHQLLDEGTSMVYKIIINLIIREGF